MIASSRKRQRLAVVLGSSGATAVLVACTFTQSLDYLQKGDGDSGADTGSVTDSASAQDGALQNVLVPNQTKPGLLAQDATSLYWVAAGTVMSVPKSGGAPKTLGMAPAARWLAADPDASGAVYLAVGKGVVRLPKDGSGGGTIFKAPGDSPEAAFVAADQNALFVLQYDDVVAESFIVRMAPDGGAPVTIAGDGGAPSQMTVDPTNLFWLDPSLQTSVFYELPKTAAPSSPGTALPLGPNDEGPSGSEQLAVDDGALYWATEGAVATPSIMTRKREPSAAVIALYRGKAEDVFGAVAVDATHVYVVEKSGNAILRVPKAGGNADRLLTGLPVPIGLVVDDTSFYVTVEATGSTGAVLKVKK